MTKRGNQVLLSVSLALNVALLAYVGSRSLLRQNASLETSRSGHHAAEFRPMKDEVQPTAPQQMNTNSSPPPFHWSQVESTDYRQYVANLRALGCPEDTIKDMLLVELGQNYRARSAAIWQPPATEYWRKPRNANPSPKESEALLALSKEAGDVASQVLGRRVSQQELIDLLCLQLHGYEQELLYLPEEKQAAAMKALADSEYHQRVAKAEAAGRSGLEDQFFQEKLKALSTVLSPSEADEFRLRHSRSAQLLRFQTQFFDCSQEEFKALFESCDRVVKESGGRQSICSVMAEQGRKVFDAERAAEFERASDLYYVNTRLALGQNGQEETLADQAWELVTAARKETDGIKNNSSLSAEEKKEGQAAIRRLRDQQLISLLGSKAVRAARWDLRP